MQRPGDAQSPPRHDLQARRPSRDGWHRALAAALAAAVAGGGATTPVVAQLTALRLQDYAVAPMTGSVVSPPATANSAYLARVNFLAEEPGGGDRFFVNDLNGPLYILDKTTRQFTTYLDFNGRDGRPGMFEEFVFASGYANGLITFQFDPDYRNNGKFYTLHMEDPDVFNESDPRGPRHTVSYGVTAPVTTPGGDFRETVLVEWTDTNVDNNTFEGSARELLRLDMQGQIHPMGDVIFNPTAGPDDPDWRVMYISVGDGGAGEAGSTSTRRTPQRLDSLGGKVLRIVPDADGINIPTTLSANGRYYIPNDNPFTLIANSNVKDEVWATGLRNPHRMSWDVDPANPADNHLIVNDIGLNSWEEVNIIYPGRNYGYSEREGNQVLITNSTTGPLPMDDTIPVRITSNTTAGTVTPTYPVIQYGHEQSAELLKGDAISSGYVYRGSLIPQLYGKFLFGDITTGQLLYADFHEMLAADDGDPSTLATIHAIDVLWDDPNDTPDLGEQLYTTLTQGGIRGGMFQIIENTYHARGGQLPHLPGGAGVTGSGNGRADVRIQVDEAGELYILSKSDGMIRQLVGPQPIPGDYNYDGVVDAQDYDVWKAAYGTTVPVVGLWADGNQNGVVDAADYTVWRNHLSTAGAASLSTVPEPAAAMLLAVGGLLAAMGTRRSSPGARSSTPAAPLPTRDAKHPERLDQSLAEPEDRPSESSIAPRS